MSNYAIGRGRLAAVIAGLFSGAGGARSPQSKLWERVSVKDYGAVGDGVTDDSDAIEQADTAAPFGYELEFEPGKVYLVTRTVRIKKATKINLNGATIKASSAVKAAAILYGEQLGTYAAIAPFAVSKNSTDVTLPAGVVAPVGSLIGFNSNTDRIALYQHGMWAVVTKVAGQNITISTPFYDAFQVDSIEVWRGYPKMEVTGGAFDLTEIANAPNFSEGLLIRGTNKHVHGIRFLGNDNAGIGVRTDGENALIENCAAYNFLNKPGTEDGGKVGYGIAVYGNNSLVRRCQVYRCKHGVASAARSKVAVNVEYESVTVVEDTTFVSNTYSGSLDLHYNVTGTAEIRNCDVTGQFNLLSLRCPAKVIGGAYRQTVGGTMIGGWEAAMQDIHIIGIKYRLASAGSFLLRLDAGNPSITGLTNVRIERCEALSTVGRMVDISRNVTVNGLHLIKNKVHGGSLFRSTAGNIDGLVIEENTGTVTEGAVKIGLAGATYSIKNYSIKRNKLVRGGASNDDTFGIFSSDGTRIQINGFDMVENDIEHVGDTGIGNAIGAIQIAATGVRVERNRIRRGAWRAVQLNGCSFTDAMIGGNVLDEVFHLTGATDLTRYSFVGNVGKEYVVGNGNPVNKTRCTDFGNNFVTYTP